MYDHASSFTRLAWFLTLALLVPALIFIVLRLIVWSMGQQQLPQALLSPPQVVKWHVADSAFGGLSALIMAPDGQTLIAGGDRGILVEARIMRDTSDQITDVDLTALAPVRMQRNRPLTRFRSDFEALTRAQNGDLFTAFEGYTRIERLKAPGALPAATHKWDRFTQIFGNQGYEALATLPDGRVIAIRETYDTPGPAPSVLYDGDVWTNGPDIPVSPDFAITGADVGPDGCLYVVERRFTIRTGFSFRLLRLWGGPGSWQEQLLYASAPADLGNAEAVSAWQDAAGNIVLTLLTDDGFLPFTPTRVMEFRVAPEMKCALVL